MNFLRNFLKATSKVRKFEGASMSQRLSSWGLTKNEEKPLDLKSLRRRARFLFNNNPYAQKAVSTLCSYVIGRGIVPYAMGLGQKKATRHESLLKEWADTKNCDVDSKLNLYGLESLALKHVILDGEIFIQKIIRNKKWPLSLKLIEADYLDDSKAIGGIEFNAQGERVAYWFFSENPDSALKQPVSKRVPASEIIHLFKKDRSSQTRGVSWFSPVLVRLKDFDEYEDAELMRQKISACFVGFFRDLEASGDGFFDEKSQIPKTLTPGSIFSAPAGQTLEFSNPPSSEGKKEYMEHVKMTLAVGFGIPYMLLSGDYSNANYSSSRMAMLNFYRHIEQIQNHILIPGFCDDIAVWFLESCSLLGLNQTVKIAWVPPKKDLTDPIKDIEAHKRSVTAGFTSHSSVIRELGEDPEEVYAEIKENNSLFDRNSFVFSTDLRRDLDARTTK